jgi:hypothetical protein
MTAALLAPRFEVATPDLRMAADAPTTQSLTPFELVDLLMESRGAKFVTLETRTEPRLLAKHPLTGTPNPHRGNVVKISRVNGMIGWQYESSVNRQRAREGMTDDFEAMRRAWGRRISGTPLVEHDGRYYVELKVERSLGHRYETLDGWPVEASSVEVYLPTRRPGRQGVQREVVLRDYAIENIVSIKMNGTTFFVGALATPARVQVAATTAAA